MRKLKKQAEDAKQRKAQVKKEKSWVGASTIPRETTMSDTTEAVKGTDWNELD